MGVAEEAEEEAEEEVEAKADDEAEDALEEVEEAADGWNAATSAAPYFCAAPAPRMRLTPDTVLGRT